jgi:hypothetical protein
MAQYLQSFIEVLEKRHPDEVLHIKREIDPVYEATAILSARSGSVASRWGSWCSTPIGMATKSSASGRMRMAGCSAGDPPLGCPRLPPKPPRRTAAKAAAGADHGDGQTRSHGSGGR